MAARRQRLSHGCWQTRPVDAGKQILRESGLKITAADGLTYAARKAVEAAR